MLKGLKYLRRETQKITVKKQHLLSILLYFTKDFMAFL